ncbi:MAG: hypothetical protein GY746_03710 [Gammaproteobacteria bacterium]|nr:hypothetical protein [Gammaproteobacteria bacterium]
MKNLLAAVLLLMCGCSSVDVTSQETVLAQGTWETTLQSRDLNNDGIVDAWYDSTLDVTWTAEPGLAVSQGSTFAVDATGGNPRGWTGLTNALLWVNYLNSTHFLGVDEWRLPKFVDVGGDGCTKGVDCGQYHDVAISELAHMYSITLGNLPSCGTLPDTCPQPGGGLTNEGPFSFLSSPDNSNDYYIVDSALGEQNPWVFDISIGAQKEPDSQVIERGLPWVLIDGDIADRVPSAPGREDSPGDYANLHCPGDVNLDGLPDLVAVTSGGRVIIRDIDATTTSRFDLEYAHGVIDSELVPDIDGNGSPELIVLGTSLTELRDLATFELHSAVNFLTTLPPIDLEIVDDVNGNGYPEVASLSDRNWAVIQVRDGKTGELLRYNADRDSDPRSLFRVPSSAQSGIRGLGEVYGAARFFRIADSSQYLGAGRIPLQAVFIPDSGGDGSPQVAVLKLFADTGVDSLSLYNTVDMSGGIALATDLPVPIGLGEPFTAMSLLVAPDMNDNGSSETVVYEYETSGTRHKARINDGRTGELLSTVRFSQQLMGLDAVVCPDINNNGSAEIAILGMRYSDDAILVHVKDTATDELLGAVSFPRL